MKNITFLEINFLTLFFLWLSNNEEDFVCLFAEAHRKKHCVQNRKIYILAKVLLLLLLLLQISTFPEHLSFVSHCDKCILKIPSSDAFRNPFYRYLKF